MEKTLYLIDGTHQIFRSFFAIKSPLTTREGLPTNAIYGFTRMLKKLLSERHPQYIAVAFDMAGPTFRHREYEEYKAHRPEAPEDLVIQLPYIRRICSAFGIPIIEKEGYEADDIIGTIAERAKLEGFQIVIVSSDKDLFQLVDGHVSMLNIQKEGLSIGQKEVKQIFGVPPEQVVDVFALWGDATDNISGVPGIGEKGSKEIISRYGSLEKALERGERFIPFMDMRDQMLFLIDRIKKEKRSEGGLLKVFFAKGGDLIKRGKRLLEVEKDPHFKEHLRGLLSHFENILKQKEKLMAKRGETLSWLVSLKKCFKDIEKGSALKFWKSLMENKELALLSQRLASIERNVPLEIPIENLRYEGPDLASLKEIFKELGFSSLIRGWEEKPIARSRFISYQIMTKGEELMEVLQRIEKRGKMIFSFLDMDESSEEKGQSFLFLLSSPDEKVSILPILSGRDSERMGHFFIRLKTICANKKIEKIGYDLKQTKKALKRFSIDLQEPYFDVKIAFYLLDPSRKDFSLLTIAKELLRKEGALMVDLAKGETSPDRNEIIEQNAQKVAYMARMHSMLHERLLKENLDELYEEIEMPLIDVLSDIEMTGIRIDGELLQSMSLKLEREMKKLEEDIYQLAGEKFNINSPKQLGDILFNKMGLKPSRKTPRSGDFATGVEILEDLSKFHSLPKKILDYRSMAKLKSSYVDALPPLIHPETKRIHSTFHQTGTATGRLSSSEPNLQNIPLGEVSGQEIRSAFIPERGNLFLSADYSQIELRILAHLSDDPEMIEAFQRGEDIHKTTISKILMIPYEKVSENQRRFAKSINFGIIYGMGPFRLSKELGISRGEAQRFIDSYFRRFKRVKDYIDETTKFVEKYGYITTLFNRVRYFKEIKSRNRMVVQQAIRQAVNTTIQGTAADLIKKAMIAIHQDRRKDSLKMVLQVHDELLFEVPIAQADDLKEWIKNKMENIYRLKVPLVVHIGIGNDWATAKPS